jgi:hypothetical protein
MKRYLERTLYLLLALTCLSVTAVQADNNPPVVEGWPRQLTSKGMTAIIYEPQIDSWDGFNLNAHAAVSVKSTVKSVPVYGVVTFTAHTLVNKSERIVTLEDTRVTDAKFPSAEDRAHDFLPVVQLAAKKRVKLLALDSMESALSAVDNPKTNASLPVNNTPPQVILANKPAVLVYIDGDPRYVPVKETSGRLRRVLNTRVLLLEDQAGNYYLHLFDGYMKAPSLQGPWTVAVNPPRDLKAAEQAARESGQIDLMAGQPDSKTNAPPSLKNLAPEVYIASHPTELVVTEGEPNYVPVSGTDLLYVSNTTGNIFKDIKDNKTYLLLSGRWFRSASLAGPWEYVPHRDLPPDFARIPSDSPKENVKASVPGTDEAKEALIADSIPETTKVKRADASFAKLQIDGDPKLEPIEGTPLSYVVNCSTPVIMVDEHTWYAVENGVWFVATSLDGPWTVADHVPAAIYAIPTSSPLHYVTYVKVYDATPDYVYAGYTPGYLGTVVTDDVVVYGTGYYYTPWIGSYWYGPPITYGLGCSIGWTPWWGWGFGFGFGWGWGAFGIGGYYPPAPWWGPYWGWGRYGHWRYHAWGPGGWAGTSANIYSRRGWTSGSLAGSRRNPFTGSKWAGRYGSAYNSRTGALIAGPKSAVRNVYSRSSGTEYKKGMPATRVGRSPAVGSGRNGGRSTERSGSQVFGTHEGRVYRSSPRGNWEVVNPSGRSPRAGTGSPTRDFSRQQRARQTGEQRYRSFQSNRPAGGFQSFRPSGGFSRGGGGFSSGRSGSGRGGGGGGGRRQ